MASVDRANTGGVCRACGRPLKTGFMANGKVVTKPSCKSPVCKRFGKPS